MLRYGWIGGEKISALFRRAAFHIGIIPFIIKINKYSVPYPDVKVK